LKICVHRLNRFMALYSTENIIGTGPVGTGWVWGRTMRLLIAVLLCFCAILQRKASVVTSVCICRPRPFAYRQKTADRLILPSDAIPPSPASNPQSRPRSSLDHVTCFRPATCRFWRLCRTSSPGAPATNALLLPTPQSSSPRYLMVSPSSSSGVSLSVSTARPTWI
jgi:hypothetical protein